MVVWYRLGEKQQMMCKRNIGRPPRLAFLLLLACFFRFVCRVGSCCRRVVCLRVVVGGRMKTLHVAVPFLSLLENPSLLACVVEYAPSFPHSC